MKVIVCTEYGPPDVLQLKKVEKPTPRDDEAAAVPSLINSIVVKILCGKKNVRKQHDNLPPSWEMIHPHIKSQHKEISVYPHNPP